MNRRTLFTASFCLFALPVLARATDPIRVLVWDERQPKQKMAYDNFLGNAIADYLKKQPGLVVKSVGIDDPNQGLSKETLDNTDVLIWWGHVRHGEIKPETAKMLISRIKEGELNLISLHSAHWSMPFKEAMNERARQDALSFHETDNDPKSTTIVDKPAPGGLPKATDPLTPSYKDERGKSGIVVTVTLPNCAFPTYREDGKPSHVTVLNVDHPLAKGLPAKFDIPATEMYSSPFHVPKPDVSIIEEKWDKGESFTSGSYWKLGKGGVVYFRPGHESYPVFKQAEPLKFIENAVRFLHERSRNVFGD